MPKVALIFPYFRTRSFNEMLFPPLGAANLTAQLRRFGIETRIFDCTFGSFTQLQKDLNSYKPDLVGIYSMVTLSRNTFRIAEMVRAAFPESMLVAGGPLPTLYPERYSQQFDSVFRGEVDLSFPKFCRDFFEQGGSRQKLMELPLETYHGLFIHNHKLQVENPSIHYKEQDIQLFPLPDRSSFDHAAYQKVWQEKNGSVLLTVTSTPKWVIPR